MATDIAVEKQYDKIAEFYDLFLARPFAESINGAIVQLLRPFVAPGGVILDVCCGTGHIAANLIKLGYLVDGVDLSMRMIEQARLNAPGANCRVADVRALKIKDCYQGVLCTYNSLNHMMSTEDLGRAMTSIATTLHPGGVVIFDMLTEEGVRATWNSSQAYVVNSHIWITCAVFDEVSMVAKAQATALWPARESQELWKRADTEMEMRCFSDAEIREALRVAGLCAIQMYDRQELGLGPEHVGRTFYTAQTP